ncbi:MAG: hypothetical protein AVDCRST_MAG93-5423, partial [uncultured Chloroflexia bacterium]
RYQGGTWESYPIDEYLETLSVRLGAAWPPSANCDADCTAGKLEFAKGLYLATYYGTGSLVQVGSELVWKTSDNERLTDHDLGRESATVSLDYRKGQAMGAIAAALAERAFGWWEARVTAAQGGKDVEVVKTAEPDKAKSMFTRTGQKLKGVAIGFKDVYTAKWAKQLAGLRGTSPRSQTAGRIGLGGAFTVGALTAVTLTLWASTGQQGENATTKGVFLAAGGMATVMQVRTLSKLVESTFGTGKTWAELVHRAKLTTNAAQKAGAVGALASIALTWGLFAHQVNQLGLQSGTELHRQLVLQTAGLTVAIVIVFMISLIPIVGQIIAAVIALIDGLAALICGIIQDANKTEAGHWLCNGLTGALGKAMAQAIDFFMPSKTVVGNLASSDRLAFEDVDMDLLDPARGFAVGSKLKLSVGVKNSIQLESAKVLWPAATDILKRSTFDYQIQRTPQDIHADLQMDSMASGWTESGDSRALVMSKTAAPGEITLDQVGINQPIAAYLAEGYVVPRVTCTSILGLSSCLTESDRGSLHIPLDTTFKLDVLPATLDDFMELTPKNGGQALAWGQRGDLTFPRLRDADGDGRLAIAMGGDDRDDAAWDTDNDQVADDIELRRGSNVDHADVDRDNLNDAAELHLGTDPNRDDTDNDGLRDDLELAGWDFVYDVHNGQPVVTRVRSDPLTVDGDQDGLTDAQEQRFAFNPNVASEGRALTYRSEVHEVNAPRLLMRFEERDGATAFADDSGFGNDGVCSGAVCPATGTAGKYGTAATFDGTNDYLPVSGPDLDLSGGTFTQAAWIYSTIADGAYHGFLGYDNAVAARRSPSLFVVNGSGIHAGFGDGTNWNSFIATNVLTSNAWNHVAVTFDGTAYRLYVNGTERANHSFGGRKPVKVTTFDIGRVGTTYFKGRIDDAAIFNRALYANEIGTLMAGAVNPNDLVVRTGTALEYAATVKNELQNRFADGVLTTSLPAGIAGPTAPQNMTLEPQEEQVLSRSLQVNGSASTRLDLTQVAGAIVRERHETRSTPQLSLNLDEASGSTSFADSSGNNRNATCVGPCPAAGVTGIGGGKAVNFGGAPELRTSSAPNLNGGTFTAAAWISPVLTTGYRGILGYHGTNGAKNRYPSLWVYNGTGLHGGFGDGTNWNSTEVPNVLTLNTWNHVAATFDG